MGKYSLIVSLLLSISAIELFGQMPVVKSPQPAALSPGAVIGYPHNKNNPAPNTPSFSIMEAGNNINMKAGVDIAISDKYTVEATDILQDANGKVQLYAGSTWEQKADSSMKIDGGSKMDIAADMLKLS